MNNSRASIRTFIMDKFPQAKSKRVGDSEDLLQGGLIDSLGILEVVSFLERQFGIVVDDEELTPEHFKSIDALTAFADGKLAEAAGREVS